MLVPNGPRLAFCDGRVDSDPRERVHAFRELSHHRRHLVYDEPPNAGDSSLCLFNAPGESAEGRRRFRGTAPTRFRHTGALGIPDGFGYRTRVRNATSQPNDVISEDTTSYA